MYWIIILCSMIFVAGRILTLGIGSGATESPFMGANDRSRWATIQAIGDHDTYEIDDVIASSGGIYRNTIDKVQHLGADGRPHYYSSKPALLPTILGYVYRGLKAATGLELADSPLRVVRLVLLLFNGGCWFFFLWLLASTLERIQARDWTRYFIVAVAGFATYLSTFTVTLNNHLPAATSAMLLVYCLVHIVNRNGTIMRHSLAGLAAGFLAANELPALSLAGLAGLASLYASWQKCLFGFLPGFMIVVAAFFATNYAAHNDWRPPYAHRGDGAQLGEVAGDFGANLKAGAIPEQLKGQIESAGLSAIRSVKQVDWPVRNGRIVNRWVVTDFEGRKITLVQPDGESLVRVHAWDNWYDFEGSYWTAKQNRATEKQNGETRAGIDDGQADSAIYSFHMLFGHHGIISLTPIWLLGFGGMVALLLQSKFQLRWLGVIAVVVTAVVLGFYIFGVSPMDRNYGGQTCAFRWALWLAPLWLIGMIPIVDWLGLRTSGRALCLILLGISAISALYASENPWVHPWLYEVWDSTGLPK